MEDEEYVESRELGRSGVAFGLVSQLVKSGGASKSSPSLYTLHIYCKDLRVIKLGFRTGPERYVTFSFPSRCPSNLLT
jgi:hypothetical protein